MFQFSFSIDNLNALRFQYCNMCYGISEKPKSLIHIQRHIPGSGPYPEEFHPDWSTATVVLLRNIYTAYKRGKINKSLNGYCTHF